MCCIHTTNLVEMREARNRENGYVYKIYRSRDCNHASSGTYINDYGRKKEKKKLSDCGIIGITIIAFVHIQISLRAPCKRVGLGFVCCCRPRNYYYFFFSFILRSYRCVMEHHRICPFLFSFDKKKLRNRIRAREGETK